MLFWQSSNILSCTTVEACCAVTTATQDGTNAYIAAAECIIHGCSVPQRTRVTGFNCTCPVGFTGPTCSTNIDDCAVNPCKNGGNCTDGVNSHTCSCPAGYHGANCENEVTCADSPCQQTGSICRNTTTTYPSCTTQCASSISACMNNADCNAGAVCLQTLANPDLGCADLDCVLGCAFTTTTPLGISLLSAATMCILDDCKTGSRTGFNCTCATGFTGPTCGTNIDDCAQQPCSHGGTCTDAVNNYTCACHAGYTGRACEDAVTCDADPCLYV